MAIWMPVLKGRRGPKYLQIVEALADDIASGRLRGGDRLPPHRDLAYDLGLSPNTTSRAYAEAVDRALIRGEVGRGTFVRGPAPVSVGGEAADMVRRTSGPIDLSRNLPLPGIAGVRLAETCAELGRSAALPAFTDYQTEADLAHHAEAAVAWLKRHGVEAGPEQAVITAGAQHGILAALMALTRPGDLLLTEALTYAPVMSLAKRLGLKIAVVAGDVEGICPDALDRLCRNRQVKALYLAPTIQTPTGRTLGQDRREAVATIIRRHDVHLIEDDVFGLMHPARPRPLATLAPERAVFVSSTSKTLAPGLRVGFVRAPERLAGAIRSAVNLSCWMPPPLMVEVVARWIADGTADRLTAMQVEAARDRQRTALALLDDHIEPEAAHGLHLWLELPPDWSADLFRSRAAERGVKVTSATAFAVEARQAPEAVRICLSHEADATRVARGLGTLRDILDEGPAGARVIL